MGKEGLKVKGTVNLVVSLSLGIFLARDFCLLSTKLFPGRFQIFLNSASIILGWYFLGIRKSFFSSSSRSSKMFSFEHILSSRKAIEYTIFGVTWPGCAELGSSALGLLVSFLYKSVWIFEFSIWNSNPKSCKILVLFVVLWWIKLDSGVESVQKVEEFIKLTVCSRPNDEYIIDESSPGVYKLL